MVRFVCEKCNFRFEAKKENACPYCGCNKVKKEPSASDVVDEVFNILEE